MADRIIAIVNEEVITHSELKGEIRGEETRLRQRYQGEKLDRQLRQLENKALTRLIERKLQMQLARERGLLATDEEVQQAIERMENTGERVDRSDTDFVKTLQQQLTVMKVLDREVNSGVTVSEDELERYYEDHKDRFMLPAEYHLSQILIKAEPGEDPDDARERAMAVYLELQAGADFAAVAKKQSDGSESVNGGSLGLVREGELELPIERALTELEPGQISEPCQTDDGFHIMRVDERKPPQYRQFAEVQNEIHNLVYKEKSQDQYHKWIAELKDKSYIELKF